MSEKARKKAEIQKKLNRADMLEEENEALRKGISVEELRARKQQEETQRQQRWARRKADGEILTLPIGTINPGDVIIVTDEGLPLRLCAADAIRTITFLTTV